MKKIINTPETYVTDMLSGIYAAHGDKVRFAADDPRCYCTTNKIDGKVAIVTGGGSGHLPLFLGYVGDGMLDGCGVGEVFQSPSAEQLYEITKAVDNGAGVLYVYGNYTGDIMNFDMAGELAEMDDIETATVVGNDDVMSAPKGSENIRRGVAGIFFLYKCAGAMADTMAPLAEVKRVAEKAGSLARTVGFATAPCIIPEVGKPNFVVEEGKLAMGMGIHGEPGIRIENIMTAKDIAEEAVTAIMKDVPYEAGDEAAVLVNGLGATPLDELYILFNEINKKLAEKGVKVFHLWAGEFATSMEMSGASITLMKVDDELKTLLAKPANTPFFKQFQL